MALGNIWTAGTAALEDAIAKRQADAFMLQDRERRSRLDAEQTAARQQEMDFRRQAMEQDAIDRAAAATEKAAAKTATAEQDALADKYFSVITDPQTPPALRSEAALRLGRMGVPVGAINQAMAIMTPEKPKFRVGIHPETGKELWRRPEVEGESLVNVPREPRGPAGPAPRRDDPTLPDGVKRWIASFAGTADYNQGLAGRKLREQWQAQQDAHPSADIAKAAQYLQSFYSGQGQAPVFGAASATLDTAEPPPGPPPVNFGRSGGAGPVGTASEPPRPFPGAENSTAPAPPGMVKMIAPDGGELDVPQGEVEKYIGLGARLK